MRITHLGHACLLVETGGTRILIDPGVFSHGFEELTGLDAVMITHQHADHVDSQRLPVLLEANDGTRLLAEPEIAVELERVGIDAMPVHPDQSVDLGGATLTGVGGIHAQIHPDVPRIGNVGVLVGSEGDPTLFHPGDSYEFTPDGVDVLAVPLSAPWAKGAETVDFTRAVGAARAVPIHDATCSPPGRGLYLGLLRNLATGTEVIDLAGAGPTDF